MNANSARFERPATPADNVNWLNAPAVPTKVLQMATAGQQPAGQILTGPQGQKTYKGPIAAREVNNDWRAGLAELPSS